MYDEQRFRSRSEAGRILASHLASYAGRADVLVLALPRGGVPIGFEIAQALRSPLDIFLVQKIGVPGQEELAIGAVASGNVRVLNSEVVQALRVPASAIEQATREALQELARREEVYKGNRSNQEAHGREIILVDDGLATGSTMHAAVAAIKKQNPKRIVVAVPVAAQRTCDEFKHEVDEIICLKSPPSFDAVGLWYENFSQLTDEDVRDLLRRASQSSAAGSDRGARVA